MIRKALVLMSMLATPVAAEPVTIAALGDSLVQGFGLRTQDGFVPQLEAWLKARGHDVDVINAGVSGDTTAGGLSRVDWTLTPTIDAMIVALGGNDLLRGVDPANSRRNIAGILEAGRKAEVALMVVGMEAPGNFGPQYKADFDAIYPELAQTYSAVYAQNFLGPIVDQADRATALRTYVQPDGLHPNAAGVALIVEHLGPLVEDLITQAGS